MAIDFPASPTTGQLFTGGNGVTYRYDGVLWLTQSGPGGGTGDFSATHNAAITLPTALQTQALNTVRSGNSGGWYNTSNGRYTPPAGRYFITCSFTASNAGSISQMTAQLTKNGSVIASSLAGTGGANYWATPIVELIVDANGSDYFEFQAGSNVASSSTGGANVALFSAFPLTGMQGPQGAPPTAGGGIIREVTLASPAATIDLFSLGVKSVQLIFRLGVTVDAAAIYLRVSNGGTVNATSNYFNLSLYGLGSTASFGITGPSLAWTLTGGQSNIGSTALSGFLTVPNITMGALHGVFSGNVSGGNGVQYIPSFTGPPTGDGFQFSLSSGNFVTGSFVRVIGWP